MDKIGYNTEVDVVYNTIEMPRDVKDKYGHIEFVDNEYYSNLFYQDEILRVFNLEAYDDAVVNDKIQKLYTLLSVNTTLYDICKRLSATYLSEDPLLGFISLFSYDCFYVIHNYICNVHKGCKDVEMILIKLEDVAFKNV